MSNAPGPLEIFFEVQRGLPRQGPGSDESTLRALALCRDLPERPVILDVGCGPGMQTVALARATGGAIAAVDTHQDYLDELRARAEAAGVADRITVLAADMNGLPVARGAFDLIWSEGAAYIMGFDKALAAWKPFLKPDGYIAVSELVWLQRDPPAEVADFFTEGYPAMTDVAAILKVLRGCGYEPISHFTLPDRDWWEHYYTPLAAKLPALYAKYAADAQATAIIKATEREIEIRRFFSGAYGYEFFVGRA